MPLYSRVHATSKPFERGDRSCVERWQRMALQEEGDRLRPRNGPEKRL